MESPESDKELRRFARQARAYSVHVAASACALLGFVVTIFAGDLKFLGFAGLSLLIAGSSAVYSQRCLLKMRGFDMLFAALQDADDNQYRWIKLNAYIMGVLEFAFGVGCLVFVAKDPQVLAFITAKALQWRAMHP